MKGKHTQFAEQLLSVRPVTRSLVMSILVDAWPSPAAVVDFGIDSQKHYEALYHPVREAEIMPKELDAAFGHGEKLTALVRQAPSNPHQDIQFSTSWDMIFGREPRELPGKSRLKEALAATVRAPATDREQEMERSGGIER